MAVTHAEVRELADTVADLFNRMTKDQWDTFFNGMLMSDADNYSQQMIMDGFATLISDNGCQTTWVWDTSEDDAEAAAQERQRQIARGQFDMFSANER